MRNNNSPRRLTSPSKAVKILDHDRKRLIASPTKDKPLNNSLTSPRKQKKTAPTSPDRFSNNTSPSTKATHRRTNSDSINTIIRPIKTAIKLNFLNKSDIQNFPIKKLKDEELLAKLDSTIKLTDDELKEKILKSIAKSLTLNKPLLTTHEFYKIQSKLGKGAFGVVYSGVHRITGLKVALKKIKKSLMKDDKIRNLVVHEAFVMNQIRHKNVLRLLELYETDKNLTIVTEFVGGGDLEKYTKKNGKLSESEAKDFFLQIIDSVIACHAENIIHRDIKPENILMDSDKTLKLCDFGFSRIANSGMKISEKCGTPAYLAPEVLLEESYEPFFIDVWSMGVLLYKILCADLPFKAVSVQEIQQILAKNQLFLPDFLSEQVKDLIRLILNPIPEQRIKLCDIKKHEWLKDKVIFSENNSERKNQEKHEKILGVLNGYGFSREYVEAALAIRDINHATATFKILEIN